MRLPQELSLLNYEFLQYAPSEVAAAAVLLALGHQEVAAAQRGWFMPASAAFAPLAARSGYRAEELLEVWLALLHVQKSICSCNVAQQPSARGGVLCVSNDAIMLPT